MKKFTALILCIVFCLGAFAGCSSLKEEEKGANVRMYLTDFPYTLDPAVVQLNSDVEQILSLIYEPLTTIDENGKVQPALAEKWYYKYDEIYELHKMYFELKTTSWSDNRQVTADDVIYAWRRILAPEMDSPYASLLYGIKGARDVKSGVGTIDDLGLAAVDDTLLEVTFEKAYDYDLFAEQVANIHLAPCREDVVTRCEKANKDWAASSADIVCSGPFRIQSMDMPRQATVDEQEESSSSNKFACKLVLERNSYYLRVDEDEALDKYVTPYRITCYYYEGQTDFYDEEGLTQEAFQANRYLGGEVYYLSAFEKNTYNRLSSEKSFESHNTLNGFAFYFNTKNELLSDAKVRQAFSAALDRNAIVSDVTGTGEIAATGYVPNGVFNTDRKSDFREVGGNLYNTSSDMDTAKSLVSGATKGTLTVTYLVPYNDFTIENYGDMIYYSNVYSDIAKAAGEYWEELGYDIEYRGLNPDDFVNALKRRDYDIIGLNIISGSNDAFNYLAPFAKEYSGAASIVDNSIANDEEMFRPHYTNIDDADYSELITTALNCTDRAERADFLHDAEDKLVELCPATMVFWYTNSFVASKKISGYEVDNWFGYTNFTDLKLSNWRKVNESENEVSIARNEK